ncbi:MAG TPA: ATP-dependent protease ATPase subunit HslU [Candidatus Eisenbacteria bacterium]|nr:ATP-dependent protease ATPase subunit HslU [Candidatus Eisenbacteria bacterium]
MRTPKRKPVPLAQRKRRAPRELLGRLRASDKDGAKAGGGSAHGGSAGGSAAAAAAVEGPAGDGATKEAEEVEELTPRQIVEELDKYVIGQKDAKRAVAISLRNRWRRWRIEEDIRDEILPNNILLIGPTGVGKTEIARRLARLAQAPFVKVEASKFTEVGYVGRDVESMIRDLLELAVNMVRSERTAEVEEEAWEAVDDRILDLLLPPPKRDDSERPAAEANAEARYKETREKLKKQLADGKLERRLVEIDVASARSAPLEIFSNQPWDETESNLQEFLSGFMPQRRKRRKVAVSEARELLFQEEVNKLLDMDKVISEALDRAENTGIVFIDEIDKIVAPSSGGGAGPDISREGVQRDLLPVVEGSNVPTKYGMVKTDHILFLASGAFHHSKPSDLIPELQGRFPIRVEMQSLSQKDFVRILTEPENALVKQYQALLASDGVKLTFDDEAIEEISRIATRVNEEMENIGARRLHTVISTLLEDVLFDVPESGKKKIRMTRQYVQEKLEPVLKSPDLTRYIL